MQNQGHQSLQLTEEVERRVKNLRLKTKVKEIMKSNKDIDVKRSLVENLIEEGRLKKKDYDEERTKDNRDERLAIYNENHQRALEMLGGTCIATGTTEKLDFAHRDPSGKVFTVAKRLNNVNFFNIQKDIDELHKCSLLCRSAHLAYDRTWVSLGYPQNEKTFPIWLDSYKKWYNGPQNITYREYLINHPRHGETAS